MILTTFLTLSPAKLLVRALQKLLAIEINLEGLEIPAHELRHDLEFGRSSVANEPRLCE